MVPKFWSIGHQKIRHIGTTQTWFWTQIWSKTLLLSFRWSLMTRFSRRKRRQLQIWFSDVFSENRAVSSTVQRPGWQPPTEAPASTMAAHCRRSQNSKHKIYHLKIRNSTLSGGKRVIIRIFLSAIAQSLTELFWWNFVSKFFIAWTMTYFNFIKIVRAVLSVYTGIAGRIKNKEKIKKVPTALQKAPPFGRA
jgi:hypothetical protein